MKNKALRGDTLITVAVILLIIVIVALLVPEFRAELAETF